MGPTKNTGVPPNIGSPFPPELLMALGPDALYMIANMLRAHPSGVVSGFGEMLPASNTDLSIELLTSIGLPPGFGKVARRMLPSVESLLKALPQPKFRGVNPKTKLESLINGMDSFLVEHGDPTSADDVYNYLKSAGLDKNDMLALKYRYGKHRTVTGGMWENPFDKSASISEAAAEDAAMNSALKTALNRLLGEL